MRQTAGYAEVQPKEIAYRATRRPQGEQKHVPSVLDLIHVRKGVKAEAHMKWMRELCSDHCMVHVDCEFSITRAQPRPRKRAWVVQGEKEQAEMVETVQHRLCNRDWAGSEKFQEMLGVIKEEQKDAKQNFAHEAQENRKIKRVVEIQTAKTGM